METQLHQSELLPSVSNVFQITRMTEGVKVLQKFARKTDAAVSSARVVHLTYQRRIMCASVYLYAVQRLVQVDIHNKVSVLFQLGVQ